MKTEKGRALRNTEYLYKPYFVNPISGYIKIKLEPFRAIQKILSLKKLLLLHILGYI